MSNMVQRRFFQIHLSTAVVLMLVAGVLVWANVRERKFDMLSFFPEPVLPGEELIVNETHCGWPFVCKWSDRNYASNKILNRFSMAGAIKNSLTALAILLSVCVACEWRIRRRAVPPQKPL